MLLPVGAAISSLPTAGELQRTECSRTLREIAIPLGERTARGDLTGEVCHWADGYHLNVRLYEKLLFNVFDVLDEGKLTEEVEEILELLKSTWKILGITETIHQTCYAWVLFHQGMQSALVMEQDQIESYVLSSTKSAFSMIMQTVETTSGTKHEHPLALLAEETKKLLKKDSTIFMPILSEWDPRPPAISASILHKLCGNKLKPFLDGIEHLMEDVVSVFPASDSLLSSV